MNSDTFTLENILTTLQKQLKGIRELERRLIEIDQLLISLKAKESLANQKLKNLFKKQENLSKQKTALQNILDESTKSGFEELSFPKLDQLKKIWAKEDKALFQTFTSEENKFSHFQKKYYLANKQRILRIIFCDINQNYHYQDMSIPNNLKWFV